MTNIEKIHAIANQLANEGKKPTVALVKTSLPEPQPLPVIINALKSWQHKPEKTITISSANTSSIEENNQDNNSEELAVIIEQAVKQAIAPLEAELKAIKALLTAKK